MSVTLVTGCPGCRLVISGLCCRLLVTMVTGIRCRSIACVETSMDCTASMGEWGMGNGVWAHLGQRCRMMGKVSAGICGNHRNHSRDRHTYTPGRTEPSTTCVVYSGQSTCTRTIIQLSLYFSLLCKLVHVLQHDEHFIRITITVQSLMLDHAATKH